MSASNKRDRGLFIIDLTPFVPLSFEGEGEGLVVKELRPFNQPLINDLAHRQNTARG